MGSLVQNGMFIAILWIVVLGSSLFMATMWMVYLIKIVMNEDEIQEKIRRHKRIGEEIIRASQNKA